MASVQVRMTAKGRSKLKRVDAQANQVSVEALRDITKAGFTRARDLIPKQTKQTWRALDYEVTPTQTGATSKIVVRDIPRGELNYSGKLLTAQDMATIMAKWSGAKSHFRTGSPDFMKRTQDYLRDISRTKAKKHFKNFKFY